MAYRLSGAKKGVRFAGFWGSLQTGKCPYTVSARPKMVHCYCMLPIFKEAKEDFAIIAEILEK